MGPTESFTKPSITLRTPRLMGFVAASFVLLRRTPGGTDRVLRKGQHYIKDSGAHAWWLIMLKDEACGKGRSMRGTSAGYAVRIVCTMRVRRPRRFEREVL